MSDFSVDLKCALRVRLISNLQGYKNIYCTKLKKALYGNYIEYTMVLKNRIE